MTMTGTFERLKEFGPGQYFIDVYPVRDEEGIKRGGRLTAVFMRPPGYEHGGVMGLHKENLELALPSAEGGLRLLMESAMRALDEKSGIGNAILQGNIVRETNWARPPGRAAYVAGMMDFHSPEA
jgi:hypothetical protein